MNSMKLLTPISHLFKINDSIQSEIRENSDLLEARERTCDLTIDNTTHYHIDFDLNLGITENQKQFLIDNVRDRLEITTLTFQAACDCEKVEINKGMYVPCSLPISLDQQIKNTLNSVRVIKDIVGSDRKIGIENNNYYPTGAYNVCTSLPYLLAVLQESNLELLFDIAHAKVTCYNNNISFLEYSSGLLDLNMCNQVHVCQPLEVEHNGETILRDIHELPTDDFTEMALSLMRKYSITYFTCEYYRDATILCEYLKKVRNLFNDK